MNLFAAIGLGIIGMSLCVLLKQYKPEYGIAVSLLVGVLLFFFITQSLVPVLEELNQMFHATRMPMQSIEILIKSLGICFLTEIACDTCKDAGESAIAAKLELVGKACILLLSLPLFQELLSIVAMLLSE